MDLARAPRRRPLTARKKGSGYENARGHRKRTLGTRLVPRLFSFIPTFPRIFLIIFSINHNFLIIFSNRRIFIVTLKSSTTDTKSKSVQFTKYRPISLITGTTEYFDKIQNNRYSTFRLNYSHHQEMNDDDITYVQVYIVK